MHLILCNASLMTGLIPQRTALHISPDASFRGISGLSTLAHPERRKRPVLLQVEQAFTHHLKRRREGGSPHGRAHGWIDGVIDEKIVQLCPIRGDANEPFQGFARIDQGPHESLAQRHPRIRILHPLAGIGAQEIVERCPPLRTRDVADGLGLAAGKELTPQLRPLGKFLRSLPHGLEPFQAQGECRREVSRARLIPLPLGSLRQEQPRFEIGEPGRHDEIISRKLKAYAARLLDEAEILFRERQDGDPRKIDLLAPRELQQQVQRAFKSVYIDDQGGVVIVALRLRDILERQFASHGISLRMR
ncbi:hypothetical protein CHELA1G11_11761 [Hyphomicrobiales bacterium]|nr:hypothetical protein CHELA1G11_11761 [Hyphomicrobiales bacterium]CAH1665559.1 hypothetical protein CHELA1G2_12545 [Hyphomicrobiales bacterium]